MKIEKLCIGYFIELIKNNNPFSLSRFGDGEILCMFHPNFFRTKAWPYDNWIYSCGDDLKQIIINNYDYYHGFNWANFEDENFNGIGSKLGIECLNFLNEHNIETIYEGDWQGYDIRLITHAINTYTPVFIGGRHLSNVKYIHGITDMELIVVDDINAYNDKNDVIETIIEKYNKGSRMFCFSAGVLSKVIIDELFPTYGNECFMIDFGSVWDPYCGKLSRSGMRKVGFKHYQPYTKLRLV